MRLTRAALVVIAAIAASLWFAPRAGAQQYGDTTQSYPPGAESTQPLPDPFAILEEDGSTFSVPIPGGGEIQVQGPESEPAQTISPIENWAVQRNTPFSVGGAPIGPAPTQR